MSSRRSTTPSRGNPVTVAIVAGIVLVIVAGAVAVYYANRDTGSAPAGLTADGGYVYSAQTLGKTVPAAVQTVPVIVYEDFQCPVCKGFEGTVGGYLTAQAQEGGLAVEYRPIAILNRLSTTDYSTRSAAAAACVFESGGIAAFKAFHDLLYANQPSEGSPGLPDSQLSDLAGQAGASGAGACISSTKYESYVNSYTTSTAKAGTSSTPTVVIGGKPVTGPSGSSPGLQDVISAVAAARSGQ
ncbi:MAG: DsbA family protein [Nocardioidaceae bacterium]